MRALRYGNEAPFCLVRKLRPQEQVTARPVLQLVTFGMRKLYFFSSTFHGKCRGRDCPQTCPCLECTSRWEARAVQQAEPAEDCVLLCGGKAIALMGSHAVGKCETLPISAERKGRSGTSVLLGGRPKFNSKGENETKQHKTKGAKGFLYSLVDCPRFWYGEVKEGRMLLQETQILFLFSVLFSLF